MKLSKKQIDYLAKSHHSFNITVGAVSTGKTYITNMRTGHAIMNELPENSLFLITGKSTKTIQKNILKPLKDLNPLFKTREQPAGLIYPKKNIEVVTAGAVNKESWANIQGLTYAGWYADEVTLYPRSFYDICVKGCRHQGRDWPKFLTCNPDTPTHYVKKELIDNEKGVFDTKTWNFVIDDNPVLEKSYIEMIKATFSGVYYQRFIEGLWVIGEGVIYPYDESIIIEDEDLPEMESYSIGLDFGLNMAAVLIGYCGDNVYILDEIGGYNLTASRMNDMIKQKWGSFDYRVWCDPAGGERLQEIDYSDKANNSVDSGINCLMTKLENGQFFIHSQCNKFKEEMLSYRRDEKGRIVKENDHYMDAGRYGIYSELQGGVHVGYL